MPFGPEAHGSSARERNMDAGVSLVALLHADRSLDAVRGRLPEDVEVRVRGAMRDATDRAALVRDALSRVRPPLAGVADCLRPRLATLLAASLSAEEARRVLASAPLSRASFEPERALLDCALRVAQHARAKDGEPDATP